MTPDEMGERLVRLEAQQSQLQAMFAEHIRTEEEQFENISMHVKELRDILVGARGASKVLGWIIIGAASLASAWTWISHTVSVRLH